jgi:hypothetical protein
MPYLLRKIRKIRWDPELKKEIAGLTNDECPADCLGDLETANCCLSLWQVADDQDNLGDIIAALGANCRYISPLDYALIPRDRVEEIAELEQSRGKSSHNLANDNWHWDLVGLSAGRLTRLAEVMYDCAERVRIAPKELEKLIRKALEEKKLDTGKVNIKL